jgi:SAM-dependent methyltransferase
LGLEVHGLDLSVENIREAKQIYGEEIVWQVQDMRLNYREDYFDCIFNLFTSFGYFNNHQDNIKVMKAVHQGLKKEGIFVLDFLNLNHVSKRLIPHQSITKQGITFTINKWIEGGIIYKQILFQDRGKEYEFTEQVQALSHADFLSFFTQSGFKIIDTFGDYDLNPFSDDSERLIFITQKI